MPARLSGTGRRPEIHADHRRGTSAGDEPLDLPVTLFRSLEAVGSEARGVAVGVVEIADRRSLRGWLASRSCEAAKAGAWRESQRKRSALRIQGNLKRQ